MRTLVIYPGRFHPFHRGHKSSYDHLAQKFGRDNVYVVTTDKQAPITSPFSFADKQNMMIKLGVPSDHIVKVRNPYQAQELTQNFDPENTAVIFALSEKDVDRFNFAPKRDGSPSYMQPIPDNPKKIKPMNQHGYVVLTPTVKFRVAGADANSASEIRNRFMRGNDNDRIGIINDLYGEPDKNLLNIFNKRLEAGGAVTEMLHRARTIGLTESEIAWLDRARLMEREALGEFDNPTSKLFEAKISNLYADYVEENKALRSAK
jgi:hypothetical protein